MIENEHSNKESISLTFLVSLYLSLTSPIIDQSFLQTLNLSNEICRLKILNKIIA